MRTSQPRPAVASRCATARSNARRHWSQRMRSESLRMALQVLVRKPGRSALTVLGLAIGVAAFIAMVSFGQGARRAVLQQFENLGANIVRVRPRAAAGDIVAKLPRPLSAADVEALRHKSTALAAVVPLARRSAQ